MRIVWSPQRIGEIAAYIAADNPAAARQWVDDVFARAENLLVFPEGGRHVPEVRRPDLRELVMGNFYRIKAQEIAILTVRHFKQNLPVEEINEPAVASWG